MPMNKRGARVGAAAFVLGLSLAGPQAAGVAAAEESDSPTVTSHTTRGAGATRSATGAIRAGADANQSAVTAPPAAATSGRDATKTTPKARAVPPRSRPHFPAAAAVVSPVPTIFAAAPAAPAAPKSFALVGLPSPAVSTAGAAGAPVAALAPISRQLPTLKTWLQSRRELGAASPGVATPVAVLTAAVNNFLGSSTNWLSTLPAGPVTEFLQGALMLVRRTLSTFLPGVGSEGTTVTATPSPYFTDQQLRDYLLAQAKEQYGGLFGQTLPYYNYGPYYKYLDGAAAPDSTVTSDTNTQVNGVDEADVVETDGKYLYVAHNNQLTIFDTDSAISSQAPVSQTGLSGNVVGQFLAGDRLTVITQSGSGWYGPTVRMAAPWYWNPQTTVTVFDVTDRTAPAVVTQTVFDGGYRDARAVDGTVYLVMDRSLNMPAPAYTEFTVPADPAALDGQAADVVAAAKIRWDPNAPITYRTYETWDSYVARVGPQITTLSLPHAYSVDADGNLVDLGVLAGPADIVRPATDGQQSLVTVVSMNSQNASAGSHFADSVGALVYSSGDSIYMNSDALYVASNQDNYSELGSSTQTRIDRFTVNGTDVGWQASGVVPGSLVNQFSMDEQGGYLHVATHTWSWQMTPGADGGADTWTSHDDNGVYVLDTAGDTLDVTGSLTGLAPGEQLYAARFVGDTAYLVTFVRTDPLFAVDLSRPNAPALQGELVIPGFSNYLQPVGDGLLLGIGQERQAGTNQVQVSLFDVSDGTHPTQIDRQFLDENSQWSWSDAQFDHHALLYSPEDGLLVVPVSGSGYDSHTGTYHSGQMLEVLHIDASGIQLRGEIPTDGTVIRTVRIGNVLYAVSADHVIAYNLDDLSVIGSPAAV